MSGCIPPMKILFPWFCQKQKVLCENEMPLIVIKYLHPDQFLRSWSTSFNYEAWLVVSQTFLGLVLIFRVGNYVPRPSDVTLKKAALTRPKNWNKKSTALWPLWSSKGPSLRTCFCCITWTKQFHLEQCVPHKSFETAFKTLVQGPIEYFPSYIRKEKRLLKPVFSLIPVNHLRNKKTSFPNNLHNLY